MLKTLGTILVIAIIALLGVAFYLGAFNPVTIETAVTGPYKMACLDHIGPYKNICKKISDSKKLLDQQGITYTAACALYYDDPKEVSCDKLRSKGGYIVDKDFKADIVEKIDIPQREAVVAKIKAHPWIAALKIYKKIFLYMIENNLTPDGPSMEIYHDNGIVETQMRIKKQKL